MPPPIRLVVGLGNPGPEYAQTRHNAGYWFLDALAARLRADLRPATKFLGETGECELDGEKRRLLKPGTFMNRSGQSMAAMARFYKYPPEDILIAHDDIDLPPGSVRLKRGGGDGGHNGLRDIIAALGTVDFHRLRIGVGHPGSSDEVVDYVLRRATAEDQRLIEEAIDNALAHYRQILAGDLSNAMNVLHRRKPKEQENHGEHGE